MTNMDHLPTVIIDEDDQQTVVKIGGEWTALTIPQHAKELSSHRFKEAAALAIDCTKLEALG
jgi:anti-anti-sigma regulatory factor